MSNTVLNSALVAAIFVFAIPTIAFSQDVVYIPAQFPITCARSLTRDQSYCPPNVTRVADDFCSSDLRGLRDWAKRYDMPVCGQSQPATVDGESYDQILLVDDRHLSSNLRTLLGPLTRADGVLLQGGPYRDRGNTVRMVLVVYETGALLPENSPAADPNSSATAGQEQEQEQSNNQTNSQETDEVAQAEVEADDSFDDMTFSREILQTNYNRNFLQFKTDLAMMLASSYPRQLAYSFVDESKHLREFHRNLLEMEFDNDTVVEISVLIIWEGSPDNITAIDFEDASIIVQH